MILQSVFLSAVRVVFDSVPLDWLGDIFVNQAKIQRIQKPVFFIHGRQDEVVPFPHGERLQQLHTHKFPNHQTEPMWISGAGHNDIESSRFPEFIQRLQKFIQRIS